MRNVLTNIIVMLMALLLANEASAQRVMPTVRMYGEFGLDYTKGKIIVCNPDSLVPDTFDMYAKFRGGTSLNYKKKNFAVKLVDSTDSKITASLLGMRDDNSWILDAMAIDKARMRNRVAFDIWNAMDVKPYYSESEPKARTGISGKFVELYINDEYNGIYCLNEKLDRKQLKLKKMSDGDVRGVLYKGFSWNGTSFGDDPEIYDNHRDVYQGFESVYPDVDDNGLTEWEPLVEKERFVVYSTLDEYAAGYMDHFDVPVLMNMHILINTIGAIDNKGKNQFFYIYDITKDRKMSFAPWDMDCSFGRTYDSSEWEGSYDGLLYENHIITQINEVSSSFLMNTSALYFDLRKTVLASDSIKSRFDNYWKLFEETGAAQREYDRWSGEDGIILDFEEEKRFVYQFIDRRLAFLDEYYGNVRNVKSNPSAIANSNGVVYDMLGRRVHNLQPEHIYIMDGKVVWIMR